MSDSIKYFQAKVNHLVSNGALKIKFVTPILKIVDPKAVDLLSKSQSVVEVDEAKARELCPKLFEGQETDGTDGEGDKLPSRKELNAQAIAMGISEDDVKKCTSKQAVVDLMEAFKKTE